MRNMISQKEISNKEIIQEVYKLIDENKHLNAFITLNEESSLKKACDDYKFNENKTSNYCRNKT